MKLSYGLSTSLADNYRNAAIETITFAIKHNFDVVEIFCETPDVLPDKINHDKISQINKLARENNIRIQVHAPFHSLNLASFNKEIRDTSIRIIKETIILANKLNSPIVTFHLGLCFLPCQLNRKTALKLLIESLWELVDFAKKYNIVLAIENRGGKLDIGRLEDILYILDRIHDEKLRVTFDVVQANAIGDPLEYYELLKKFIVNIHVSDSPRGKSLLLAVGKGEIEYKELVGRLIKDKIFAPLVFEVSNKDYALESRNMLERYISELSGE